MTVAVDFAGPGDKEDWSGFVDAAPDAQFFHRGDWRDLLAGCFPYRDASLIARTGGHVVGVLPLMSMRSPLTGSALISMPLGISAGPLAETAAVRDALIARAVTLVGEIGGKYLELRDVADDAVPADGGWHSPSDFAIFEKDISDTPEAALLAIPRKQRAEVRRGMKAGLVAVDGTLDEFYPLYCRTMRGHGTPPMPMSYFRGLVDTFAGDVDILAIRRDGRTVCAVLSFYHRNCVLPYYAGALDEARTVGGFAFMYYALMKRALARGVTRFNFGRSFVDSGAYAFKVNFGFSPRPARYRFYAARPQDLPGLHPDNPKLKPLLAVWRKLPLPVTVLLGSRLSWMAP